MKHNLKMLSLVALLGSLFYFISSYTKSKLIANSSNNYTKEIIAVKKIENNSKLIAPKVYISTPFVQNGLEVGSN